MRRSTSNLFLKRREKEREAKDFCAEKPKSILSTNIKTGVGISFPVSSTCAPSKVCAEICYACKAKSMMMWTPAIKKSIEVYNYFQSASKEEVAAQIYKEFSVAQKKMGLKVLRWNVVGDLHAASIAVINYMAEHEVFCGINHLIYSRKPDQINQVLVRDNIQVCLSIDKGSEYRVKQVTRPVVICFLRADEYIPDIPIDIIFPFHQGYKDIPVDARDCPCDRKIIPIKLACAACNLCFKPERK